MPKIPLSKGAFATVDERDFEYLSQFNWFLSSAGYAVRNQTIGYKKRKSVLMHREIMATNQNDSIDHIDGDPLNNCRNNLRACSHKNNLRNQKIRRDNSSGYRGVYFYKKRKKWVSRITVNYKMIRLGDFDNKHDAARMYNFWASDLFGEYARLNVIKEAN